MFTYVLTVHKSKLLASTFFFSLAFLSLVRFLCFKKNKKPSSNELLGKNLHHLWLSIFPRAKRLSHAGNIIVSGISPGSISGQSYQLTLHCLRKLQAWLRSLFFLVVHFSSIQITQSIRLYVIVEVIAPLYRSKYKLN